MKELNTDNFHKDKGHKDWFRSECKECSKREHDLKKEQRRMQSKRWRENNKERVLIVSAIYRETHKDKIHKYYIDNKEEKLEKSRAYYKIRKERHNQYTREYYKTHKEEVKVRIRNNVKKKWYSYLHSKTCDFIKKNNLRPNICSICWSHEYIYAHHIDNNIWNKVVFCCKSCHQRIHSWAIECPKPIDLLFIKKEHDDKNSKGFTPKN